MTEIDYSLKHVSDVSPDDFIMMWINADSHEDRKTCRKQLKELEGGRFRDMLESMYDMFCYGMTAESRQNFAVNNKNMVRWMGVYALLEDMNTFPEYTDIQR